VIGIFPQEKLVISTTQGKVCYIKNVVALEGFKLAGPVVTLS
jgi:hypothetical protein